MKIDLVEGNIVIVIPCSAADRAKAPKPAEGKKMHIMATTHGFCNVSTPAGIVRVSLNAGF